VCGHPNHVIMLTCDAFGVMPPIARLTPQQAQYHFLSGYTARVAGTEVGVTEPQATFSTCFGAPFMVLHPSVYSNMLRERLQNHDVTCWLINTGWAGNPAGRNDRISIMYSRAMVRAVLSNTLNQTSFTQDPVFHFEIPDSCPGVPSRILHPRKIAHDPADYDARAQKLFGDFKDNFKKYEDYVPSSVKNVL